MLALWELVRTKDWEPLLFIASAVLFVGGLTLIFSLRQTFCYLLACVVAMLFVDGCIFAINASGGFTGRGAVGAAIIFLLAILGLIPVVLVIAWVIISKLLLKRLPFSLRDSTRRIVGGGVVAISLAVFAAFALQS